MSEEDVSYPFAKNKRFCEYSLKEKEEKENISVDSATRRQHALHCCVFVILYTKCVNYRGKFRFKAANKCAMRCRMQNHPTRKMSLMSERTAKRIINSVCASHAMHICARDTRASIARTRAFNSCDKRP